jgi:5-methylcytosine-specific restriction endonuclease McrA
VKEFPYILHKEDAVELGIKFFYSGRPCRNGHASPRYTKTHMCLACRRMHETRRIKAAPGAHREKSRLWHANNREKGRAMCVAYRAKFPERQRQRDSIRRTRQYGGEGGHTEADILEIHKMQRGKCAYCRVVLGRKFHADHIVALSKKGSNVRSNIQLLCAPCNQSKGARDPVVFAQSLGMLL